MMLAHLLASHNAPFLVALLLFVGLGTLQLVSLLIGGAAFGFLDDMLPETDVDVEVGAPAGPGLLAGALSLLGIGKVPAIVALLMLLFWFSFIGYNLQLIVSRVLEEPLSAWFAASIALCTALPLVRLGSELWMRIMPSDESLAVSEETFVGKLAKITLGTVTHARASEAKLEDEHGHTHYVQVIADEPAASFRVGEEVIIVGRRGTRFTVVSANHLLEE